MTTQENTGYVIDPKKCVGCRYAIGKGTWMKYSHCDLYFQTKRKHPPLRPTPDENGNCIYRDASKKQRSTLIWEEF